MRRVSGTMALVAAIALAIGATPTSATAKKPQRGPIHAKVVVSEARSSSAFVTVTGGGTIKVKARNGTKMTVKFPPEAVLEDTLVTAAPLKKVKSKVTDEGMVAGIQLLPEGLQLAKPATVRFARKGKAAKRTRIGFMGSEGDGRDLHLLPPPVRLKGRGEKRKFVPTGGPVVSITHFSTVSAFDWSTATLQDIQAILYPGAGIHRMQQAVAEILRRGLDSEELVEAYELERKRLIDPLLDQALAALRTTCSVKALRGANTAISIALSFDRQLQLLGIQAVSALPIVAEMFAAAGDCMVSLCPKLGDPTAGTYLLFLARQLAVLGGGDDFYEALFENMYRCGAYELHIDSRMYLESAQGGFTYQVVGKVKVVPRPETFGANTPRPRGPLEFKAASGSVTNDCGSVQLTNTTDGEFQLSDIEMVLFNPEKPAADPLVSLQIAVIKGPTETYQEFFTDPDCIDPKTDVAALWFTGFHFQHPGFAFDGADFLPDDPPVFAIGVFGPNTKPFVFYAFGTIRENTKIEIIHTPEPPVAMPPPNS